MRVRVKVTAEHIARGVQGSSYGCPIALALSDAGHKGLAIGGGAVFRFVGSGAPRLITRLPGTAIRFIGRFDAGWIPRETFKPFEFDLDLDLPSHTK